jgi:hypothetical protein
MIHLIGLAAASVGTVLIAAGTMTKEAKSFQVSVLFGVPMMLFGLKMLIGI